MMRMVIMKNKKKMAMVMMESLPFSSESLPPFARSYYRLPRFAAPSPGRSSCRSARSYCRLPGDVAVIPELLPTTRRCCPFAWTELMPVCPELLPSSPSCCRLPGADDPSPGRSCCRSAMSCCRHPRAAAARPEILPSTRS